MNKKNDKNPLSADQREVLNKLHNAQITFEVALTVFILSIYTINLVSVLPVYGIVALLAICFSGILLFISGIIITATIFSAKRMSQPLQKDSRPIRRWLIIAWLGIPLTIFFLLLAAATQRAENAVLCLVLGGITALLTLIAVILSLVGIHRTWKRFNKKRISHARVISYGAIGFAVLLLTLLGTYTTTEAVKFSSTPITDSNLELGQTEIRQTGKDGEKQITHNLIFGTPLSTETTKPVDEIIAKGSRKYQYMYCSNGSYRYFTAEQFKDPNVGFTHQSPDHCAQNGAGTQTTIADVPPAEKIVQQVPVYRSPSYTTCTESYFSGSFTCRSY
jgi:hypothetical protein